MKPQFFAVKLAILTCLVPVSAQAQAISGFTIFGDSLSDNGNAFRNTNGLVPPSPPYVNGRFTNGVVWVEDLATKLNLTPTTINFAFGGATSGTNNTITPLLPGVTTQVNGFLQSSPSVSPSQAFVVWAGANDYLGGGITNPAIPVGNIGAILQRLTAAGANKLVVPNLPDLGRVPGTVGNPVQSAGLTQLSTAHNQGLQATLRSLAQSNPNLSIVPIDINALFNQVLNDPARFGFTNVTQACLGTGANCDQFLFWDQLHPTARGHQIISEYAFSLLSAPLSIAPQTEIALGVARRPSRDLDGRILALRQNPNPDQKLGVFVNGDFNFGNWDSNNGIVGYDFDTKSVSIGADYRVTDNLALGLALNYGQNNSELNNNLGEVDVSSFSVSAYGSYSQEKFYADTLINFGWNKFDITRNLNVTGFRAATAEPDGKQFSVRFNSGYNLGSNELSVGPMVGVRYTKVKIDGYTERDGSILNLNVPDQEADSVILNIGAQLAYDFRSPSATITPFIAANYEHEFANGSREIVTELASQPGIPNRIRTGEPDRDFVRLSTGVQAQFANNLSVGVGYETVLGKQDVSDHAVQAQLRYQF